MYIKLQVEIDSTKMITVHIRESPKTIQYNVHTILFGSWWLTIMGHTRRCCVCQRQADDWLVDHPDRSSAEGLRRTPVLHVLPGVALWGYKVTSHLHLAGIFANQKLANKLRGILASTAVESRRDTIRIPNDFLSIKTNIATGQFRRFLWDRLATIFQRQVSDLFVLLRTRVEKHKRWPRDWFLGHQLFRTSLTVHKHHPIKLLRINSHLLNIYF